MFLQILGNSFETWGVLIIAAFAGGAFGAALGALPAFCFTGFMVMIGESANILKTELGEAGIGAADQLTVGITGSLAFGPVFGPHISFAGGAAAAAYAARKGYMDTGFDYHEAKNIAHALGTRPDVLAVGGAFGILGMFVRQISGAFALPWDPIAMGVVLSAVFHRLVFRYPMVGTTRGEGLFDMSPFEREEMREAPSGSSSSESGEAVADGGAVAKQRLAVEPWLPHQYKWSGVAAIGAVVGILAAYIAVQTGSFFLAFGISAASLLFLNLGVEQIPVTHHISLPASTAALAIVPASAASVPILPAVAIGALFGVSGALTGEVIERVFYAHSDTHFDPPAAAIVINTFFIAVLAIVGVLPQSGWVPLPF